MNSATKGKKRRATAKKKNSTEREGSGIPLIGNIEEIDNHNGGGLEISDIWGGQLRGLRVGFATSFILTEKADYRTWRWGEL